MKSTVGERRRARWFVVGALLLAFAGSLVVFATPSAAQPKRLPTVPISVPVPVPVPTIPVRPIPVPVPTNLMANLFANPTFEADGMSWTSVATITPPRRECARRTLVPSASLRHPNGQPIAWLGGNYWKVPFETASTKGEEGVCFLQSGVGGTTASPPFRQTARFVSLRARGRVAGSMIRLVTASNEELDAKAVPTGDMMARVTFDLSTVAPAHKAKLIQLVIVPAGPKDRVEIDELPHRYRSHVEEVDGRGRDHGWRPRPAGHLGTHRPARSHARSHRE